MRLISGSPSIKYRKKRQKSTGIIYHRPKCKSSYNGKNITKIYNDNNNSSASYNCSANKK